MTKTKILEIISDKLHLIVEENHFFNGNYRLDMITATNNIFGPKKGTTVMSIFKPKNKTCTIQTYTNLSFHKESFKLFYELMEAINNEQK